ncbi:MAG TPA: hypothetical protein VN642_06400 [Dongiaceae bacterium]|nr:hypothetical protein [Dongiaceae bacterium]
MKLPRIMLYALLGTFAALAIPVIAYMKIHFSPVQSPQEKEVLAFAATPLSLHTRAYKEMKRSCPVSSDPGKTSVMPGPPSPGKPGQQPRGVKPAAGNTLPVISFILNGDETPMAVIDGHVLKVGNSFGGWRVLRIEQKRVLLENRKVKKWLFID